MRLLITQSISNDNYIFLFNIDPNSISSDDAANFQKYGPQNINFGNTTAGTNFIGGGFNPANIYTYASYNPNGSGIGTGTDGTWVMPDNWQALPTAFPIQITVTGILPSVFATNTATRLTAYRNYIMYQVYNTVTALRTASSTDAFTGEFLTSI
jgi:hypothetical protein